MKGRPSTVILVPVLGRPHRVEPLLESVAEATPEQHRLLFIASIGDDEQIEALQQHDAEVLVVGGRGTYPEKINAGYRTTSEELLFLAADDLKFHPGWLSAAQKRLDGTVQVVGTNDLGNERVTSGEHSTHTLVTRGYCDQPGATIDQPGSVLCERYRHWKCDDELVKVAKHREVWAHAGDSVVEHLHPYWAKADMDDTYRLGESSRAQDQRMFARRRRLWEPRQRR